MDQSVLTALLSLATTIALTAMIAAATSARETSRRAVNLVVFVAAIVLAVVQFQHTELRVNFTGSMPIGIYRLVSVPDDGVKRGMFVAMCAPAHVAAVGLRRGYLARGPCVGHTELLLKSIAAVAGDEVRVTAAGVAVNGCLLSHSRPAARDQAGRALVPWPLGRYRIASGQVWLYAAQRRSWDSRYWGPASVAEIEAEALPLLVDPGVAP